MSFYDTDNECVSPSLGPRDDISEDLPSSVSDISKDEIFAQRWTEREDAVRKDNRIRELEDELSTIRGQNISLEGELEFFKENLRASQATNLQLEELVKTTRIDLEQSRDTAIKEVETVKRQLTSAKADSARLEKHIESLQTELRSVRVAAGREVEAVRTQLSAAKKDSALLTDIAARHLEHERLRREVADELETVRTQTTSQLNTMRTQLSAAQAHNARLQEQMQSRKGSWRRWRLWRDA